MFTFAVVTATFLLVSAQADTCEHQKDFVELLHELIETKINTTLNKQFDNRVTDRVKSVLADEPGKQILKSYPIIMSMYMYNSAVCISIMLFY